MEVRLVMITLMLCSMLTDLSVHLQLTFGSCLNLHCYTCLWQSLLTETCKLWHKCSIWRLEAERFIFVSGGVETTWVQIRQIFGNVMLVYMIQQIACYKLCKVIQNVYNRRQLSLCGIFNNTRHHLPTVGTINRSTPPATSCHEHFHIIH